MHRFFFLGHDLFLEAHMQFPSSGYSLPGTDNVRGQIRRHTFAAYRAYCLNRASKANRYHLDNTLLARNDEKCPFNSWIAIARYGLQWGIILCKLAVGRSSVNYFRNSAFCGRIYGLTSLGQRVTFGRASRNGEVDAAKELLGKGQFKSRKGWLTSVNIVLQRW